MAATPGSRDIVRMQPLLTVYHDGSCPLCRLEIRHYRRQQGADRIAFVDAAVLDAYAGADLSRSGAMAKFHVRTPLGTLLSGAAAFVAVWALLPKWHWAVSVSRWPGMLGVLEIGYVLFLPLRPVLAWIAGLLETP